MMSAPQDQFGGFAQPPRWAWIETAGFTTTVRRKNVSPSHRAGRGLKPATALSGKTRSLFRPATALGVD